jgi:hypothetical protein
MFDSVDEMVEENDRRRLEEDLPPEDKDPPTPEHVYSLLDGWYISLTESSQERLYHGYEHLIRHIPSLKTKLLNQDILELNSFFRDVNFLSPSPM